MPRSLRLRLALGAAVWIGAALVLAGAAIGALFVGNVERSARNDLAAAMARLVALIDPDAAGPAPVLSGTLPDARYDTPLSGLYWQIADETGGAALRSRSLWDAALDAGGLGGDAAGAGRTLTLAGPGGQSLLALARPVRFATAAGAERRYLVVVAQDRSILDEAIGRFGRELALALAVLGAALGLAAFLQVRIGLAPLGRLRADVEAIRRGEAAAIGIDRYPAEVLPLAGEVNELLASQRAAMEFARARAADLAHGLKTPLAVLGTVADALDKSGDARNAALLAELTGEMRDRIDYQMRLARLRQRTRRHALNSSLSALVPRTAAVLRRTQKGEALAWLVDMPDGLAVDIDGNDLVELVGVVLENAVQWAATLVCVRARRIESAVELRIGDDGPGVPASELGSIAQRGRRLDETTPGTGLGLSIASEIVALNGGSVDFRRSSHGGLDVAIRLPAAR